MIAAIWSYCQKFRCGGFPLPQPSFYKVGGVAPTPQIYILYFRIRQNSQIALKIIDPIHSELASYGLLEFKLVINMYI